MRNSAFLLAASAILATVLPAQNQDRPSRPFHKPYRVSEQRKARAFRRLRVPGEEVSKNVARLTKELQWHKTLAGALASGRNKGRPVLWIQALGDLKGFL